MSKHMKNAGARLTRRIADLARLLDQQRGLYEELFGLIDSRIVAMRRGDWNAMQANDDRGQVVVRQIAEREGLRKQAMDVIGIEMGLAPRHGRKLTVSELGKRLTADQQTGLRESADRLRGAMTRVSQANRVSGFIARGVLHHLRWVFEAVSPRATYAAYGGDGAIAATKEAVLFEATG